MSDAYPELRDRSQAVLKTCRRKKSVSRARSSWASNASAQSWTKCVRAADAPSRCGDLPPVRTYGPDRADPEMAERKASLSIAKASRRDELRAREGEGVVEVQSSTDAATFAGSRRSSGRGFVGYDRYVDVPSTVKAIVVEGGERDALQPRQ